MLTVADLMTTSVVTLSADDTLGQAAATLASLGVSGAPVCDAEQKVVGVFSKSDVVDRLIDAKASPESKVSEHMTAVPVTLRGDDTVEAAVKVMAQRMIHRVIVLDAAGKLAGILSPLDVLRAVRDGRLRIDG